MAKEIKITFYSPRELWAKFCNWVFWPRRKKCTEWCDFYDGVLTSAVTQILQEASLDGKISDEAAEDLELSIKAASGEVARKTAKLMSEPFE